MAESSSVVSPVISPLYRSSSFPYVFVPLPTTGISASVFNLMVSTNSLHKFLLLFHYIKTATYNSFSACRRAHGHFIFPVLFSFKVLLTLLVMQSPQKLLRPFFFRMMKQFIRCAFFCNNALIHENYPVRNFFCKIHFMSHHQHCQTC